METKNFSTNSFIYRFLAWPQGFLPYRKRPEDICDLRRAVIFKVFLCLFGLSAALFYIFSMATAGLFLLSKHFAFFSAYSTLTPITKIGLLLGTLTFGGAAIAGFGYLLINALFYVFRYFANRSDARKEAGLKPVFDPVLSPVKEFYTTWKNKICYRVSFE
jgi:hypothetical protein